MIVLAAILGALIGATLGALGAGGSILAVPVLVHVVGMPVGAATATSLVAVGSAAAVSSIRHRANTRWPIAGWFVLLGVPGAMLGARVGRHVADRALLVGFSLLMLVAAQRMLTSCPTCTKSGEQAALDSDAAGPTTAAPGDHEDGSGVGSGQVLLTVLAGAGVGFLTGLFGVGGGFIIVPVLTLVLGLSMRPAIATSLVVVAGNAAVALAIRGPGAVDWSVGVAFTATMLLGSLVGAAISHRLDPRRSLVAFAVILVAVSLANGVSALVG